MAAIPKRFSSKSPSSKRPGSNRPRLNRSRLNRSGSNKHRIRLLLGLLLFTSLALITLDFRGFGPLESAQNGIRDLLQPVVDVADTVFDPVSEVWQAAFGYNELNRRNDELQAEIDLLRGNQIRDEAAQSAAESLNDVSNVGFGSDIAQLVAEVTREDVGNFRSDLITINKGRLDGVRSGMAVVTGAGLAGRVDAVGSRQATVITISDPSLIVGVRLLDTNDIGLGHGAEGNTSQFVIDRGVSWPENSDDLPSPGSAVVTAASSRYPADIPIGRVVSVDSAEAGLLQHVVVDLMVDTENLRYVTILLDQPSQEPPAGPDDPFTQ